MKPIYLTLAGLQSYREKQEVDFTRLSDAGVFGIFGPTGSGKSSILDAMTLALYGKVERAPGGTQGIINQMESVCGVSFEFELSGAGGSERYRVERQYKRTGEVSVNQTISRLMRLESGEATVLADKAKDVDNRIQDILGLSMADFTRAVVLPQGKFAEFLSLKGVERRHMLERLFHLEQYGDLLGAKVTASVRETDMAVKRAEAEQLGLGDASEEALKEARKRLEAADRTAREQRAQLLAAERAAEEARRLWKLAEEQAALAAAEQSLLERLPEIEKNRLALRMADKASRVEHFLMEWESAKVELSKASLRLEAAEAAAAAAAADCERQQSLYQEAKSRLEREAEPCQIRLDSLKRALELQREIQGAERQALALIQREDALNKELAAAAELMKREQLQLDKAVSLQADLKARLSAVAIAPERRDQLQKAVVDKEKWTALRVQQSELERELRDAEAKTVPLRQEVQEGHTRLEFYGKEQTELIRQGSILREMLEDTYRLGEELHRSLVAAEEADKTREQAHYRATLAARLAGELSDGNPCPVCGSSHHPLPASAPSEQDGNTARDWKRLTTESTGLRVAVRQLQGSFAAEWSRLEPDSGGFGGTAYYEAAAAKETAGSNVIMPSAFEQEPESAYVYLAEACGKLTESLRSLEKDTKVWSQAVRRLTEQVHSDRNKLAESGAKLASLDHSVETLNGRLEAVRREDSRMKEAWADRYPGLTPEDADQEWEKLRLLQREQDELRSRLDKSGPILEGMQEKLAVMKEESFRLERERIQASTEKNGLEALLQDKRSRLYDQLQGTYTEKETEQLFQSVSAELQAMKSAEAEGRRRLEELLSALQSSSNQLAAGKQAKLSSQEAFERARSNGERELSAAGFLAPEDARAALLDKTEVSRLEEQVLRHQEQLAETRTRLSRLREQLGGRTVTEQEWTDNESKLAVEREKDEECLRHKGMAERDLEELTAKHERWKTLEQNRLESKTVLDRLLKLQSVLRGNAFVEYMAEEQLSQVSRAASERLGQLTRRRYALETDSSGGFIIRDDANGGLRRPVSTLSGGETFLTSLSLALALSAQIQLNGKFPLEFFFLDEGFGTLDPDLLETVVHALEKLHMERLTVGVISHVPELKARLPRRLVVTPADSTGAGSRIGFETC